MGSLLLLLLLLFRLPFPLLLQLWYPCRGGPAWRGRVDERVGRQGGGRSSGGVSPLGLLLPASFSRDRKHKPGVPFGGW